MSYLLSLLDKSPVAEGEGATEALARTVALARRAEHWGFHRFWVAEHHDTPKLASPSPEVLIAYLLAHTTRIRVGSGGVMLQHYSPYKVAENFNLLAALAPGRVDLGIGKAPGGLPLSTRALQSAIDPARRPSFAEQLAQLDAFLDDTIADADPLAGVVATPRPAVKAERFLLGASVESAQLAAAEGWAFVHAGHLNGDPALLERVFAAYRAVGGGKAPLLAVAVIAAETEARAERLAAGLRMFKVHVDTGQSVTVGSVAQAEEFVRQAGAREYRIEEKAPSVIHGTAERVRAELERLHRQHGVREFVIDTPIADGAERQTSIELLAKAHFTAVAA
ncbi:LLM class flavin-dependent oxidoreductase [Mycobacterium sp. KBS0706]|uniref:LLM class flavin-dependent oxidoreductase n=1 Tax=Mycobacterium sp. KBS0706 TaxID=2578109 RepID=UPI00110FA585|nr:LLM class flavin-dependent oxidoreductase [Mycobacterium sp. KBS0706]TSD85559.1 LLM class flavin-dependent oxidoreductase [Mycobacterium sp. KBS0706]